MFRCTRKKRLWKADFVGLATPAECKAGSIHQHPIPGEMGFLDDLALYPRRVYSDPVTVLIRVCIPAQISYMTKKQGITKRSQDRNAHRAGT